MVSIWRRSLLGANVPGCRSERESQGLWLRFKYSIFNIERFVMLLFGFICSMYLKRSLNDFESLNLQGLMAFNVATLIMASNHHHLNCPGPSLSGLDPPSTPLNAKKVSDSFYNLFGYSNIVECTLVYVRPMLRAWGPSPRVGMRAGVPLAASPPCPPPSSAKAWLLLPLHRAAIDSDL